MAASASLLIPLLPKWLRTRDFFRFRHVTDDKISAPVAFHFLGSLLKRLLIQRTFSGSMGMNCKGQKEISMLRKLSLVTTLAAALTLPTVAAAWDGHGGGWGGGGHHGGWGGGGWGHGGGGGGGGWGRRWRLGPSRMGRLRRLRATEATGAAGVGMDSGSGSVEDLQMSLRPLSQTTKAVAFCEQVWLGSPRASSAQL